VHNDLCIKVPDNGDNRIFYHGNFNLWGHLMSGKTEYRLRNGEMGEMRTIDSLKNKFNNNNNKIIKHMYIVLW
jgi:hypothetical protein